MTDMTQGARKWSRRHVAAGMVAVVVLAAAMVPLVSPEAEGARQKFKVLHIMSYHWTVD
jgi:hypothetical protein